MRGTRRVTKGDTVADGVPFLNAKKVGPRDVVTPPSEVPAPYPGQASRRERRSKKRSA